MSGQTTVSNYKEMLFEYPLTLVSSIRYQSQCTVSSHYSRRRLTWPYIMGLVLSPIQYTILSPNPYVQPVCPPSLAKIQQPWSSYSSNALTRREKCQGTILWSYSSSRHHLQLSGRPSRLFNIHQELKESGDLLIRDTSVHSADLV